MSAQNIFHDAVRKGLEKEGRVDMQIDLGAEKMIAVERGQEKIAVEIKSFISPSNISEFRYRERNRRK